MWVCVGGGGVLLADVLGMHSRQCDSQQATATSLLTFVHICGQMRRICIQIKAMAAVG